MVDSTHVLMVGELMMVNNLQKSSVMATKQDTLKHSPWLQQRVTLYHLLLRTQTKRTASIDKVVNESNLGQ